MDGDLTVTTLKYYEKTFSIALFICAGILAFAVLIRQVRNPPGCVKIDFKLLLDPSMMVINIVAFEYFPPIVFVSQCAGTFGLGPSAAALMTALFNIGTAIGRVVNGLGADYVGFVTHSLRRDGSPAREPHTTVQTDGFLFDAEFIDPKNPNIAVPNIGEPKYLIDGEIKIWGGDVFAVESPICYKGGARIKIGTYGMLGAPEAESAVQAAVAAYGRGRGDWPRMSSAGRIAAVEKFLEGFKSKRDEIANLIMWEICKNKADSYKEVDRTIEYMKDTIQALKDLENKDSTFQSIGGTTAMIRRRPIGVLLSSGPFNYPMNETYTTLIPGILMGNAVIMKLPRYGAICHMPTLELFRDCFPKGSGRTIFHPLMKGGMIDGLGFIGTSDAAADIIKSHPHLNKLKLCLGLEAKNPAIIMGDADLDLTVSECITGSLSFNGQRCTALKIIFVHKSVHEAFVTKFSAAVDKLKMGLPWDGAQITPLPEPNKPKWLKEMIEEACSDKRPIEKRARIANKFGGMIDRTFVAPTVLDNVPLDSEIANHEQFGPVVPIVEYDSLEEVYNYMANSPYGQQASIFGQDTDAIAAIIDELVDQVCRVNVNTQCQRGPDAFPFTGRKHSAIGTLSIGDALRVFSIRSMVAVKQSDKAHGTDVLSKIVRSQNSDFLKMEYLF
ncbi:hypothetical protein SmJEL517_g03947 [Synchytrium microbalum]|uniref:NADP-dependent glyceraldehyde-3-phosphate dehydrogenase n=1 Tax=Synchytrium microbalum TaxID=1806994 RepID=A0A507C4P0_9FUNG|nr:uncharacterized protein SmJEL517_g03947 [Synchytrium microbalum]TPX33094.1 hypothetical protein SmJEL517_g03947 [Synchytrium microbalum]